MHVLSKFMFIVEALNFRLKYSIHKLLKFNLVSTMHTIINITFNKQGNQSLLAVYK